MVNFTKPWDGHDIVFKVQDRKLHACKTILSMWSPVFKAMFTVNMKEKTAREIPLPEKKFDHIHELLQLTHPPCKPPTDDNVENLLVLIDEYQIDGLKKGCEDVLLGRQDSLKNLYFADKYQLNELLDKSIEFASMQRLPLLRADRFFKALGPDRKAEVLTKLMEKLSVTLTIIESICNTTLCWGHERKEQKRPDCKICHKDQINKVYKEIDGLWDTYSK